MPQWFKTRAMHGVGSRKLLAMHEFLPGVGPQHFLQASARARLIAVGLTPLCRLGEAAVEKDAGASGL